jgi:hypothetical protein
MTTLANYWRPDGACDHDDALKAYVYEHLLLQPMTHRSPVIRPWHRFTQSGSVEYPLIEGYDTYDADRMVVLGFVDILAQFTEQTAKNECGSSHYFAYVVKPCGLGAGQLIRHCKVMELLVRQARIFSCDIIPVLRDYDADFALFLRLWTGCVLVWDGAELAEHWGGNDSEGPVDWESHKAPQKAA